ncbi:putative enoyl-CoA hydratase echA8 [Clostridium homopropionicum DSM 5847]|uniref:Putative enoyl-CoA hydratase echA8 n=1 Tax=Clostridium homopropionicum DSM 5847 TaxID=1121318 RepID=A0A0L6Z5F3_9CLOT|nr:enoyl-CoA hydratase-related protein [Clostridium homopropionicum]KOA18185.1 putative enoyl-CoA hydratase echA8 [Clostridium homopropionicum DSM 5847]SFF71681.1 3-hydroxypropionyl-CoA dehydratase [Clostridium homopropionicum]
MNFNKIILRQENNIAILSINRMDVLNAIDTDVLLELNKAMDYISENDNINVLIVTGNGEAFSSGADISQMINYSPEQGRSFIKKGQDLFRKIEVLEKPIIAAVNGFALGGGCELAMSCDIRIAGEDAKFGYPEVNLGIIPGFGGTQRLARLVGRGKAKELIYTGEMIDAKEAEKIGLVEKVVPRENLLEEALTIARKIASKGQIAIKYAKAVMNIGIETDIDTALEIERDAIGLCFASEEQKIRMANFLGMY